MPETAKPHSGPVTTFQGHAPVQSDSDCKTHLAKLDTRPGSRETLCGASVLRESTRRDLMSDHGLCPDCIEIGWGT